jgi:2-polyprenyl-3-methyl-5-hydroxy-6-metoxy-1,4-benzoquinol methylase
MASSAPEATDPAELREVLYESYRSGFKAVEETGPGPLTRSQTAALRYFIEPFLGGLPKSAAMLDLGCGDGSLLAHLQACGFTNARGVDCSTEQARAAVARGVSATQGDLFETLAAAPAAFDAILLIDVIEHMTKPELARLGHLLRSALRPGGLLVVQTPNGEGVGAGRIVYGDLTHETIFNESSLGQYLRAFGFTDLRFRETGPVPHSLPGRLRWIAWRGLRVIAQFVSLVQTGQCPAVLTAVIIAACRAPAQESRP